MGIKYTYTALANISPLTHPEDLSMLCGYKPEHPLAVSHQGTVEATSLDAAPEEVWLLLNRDDRPNAQQAPSLSIGDVVVLHTPDGDVTYACEPIGFRRLDDTPQWEDAEDYLTAVGKLRGTTSP